MSLYWYMVTFRQWDAYGVWVDAPSAEAALAVVQAETAAFVGQARHLGEGAEDWCVSDEIGDAL